jgi:ribonuclease D
MPSATRKGQALQATREPRIFCHDDLDERLASKFGDAERIAWDIETSGLDPKADSIGTIQLHATSVGTAVIQIGDAPPQRACALLEDAQVGKVFHHAMFDLRFMVAHWNVKVRNVYCTKVASKLLDQTSGDAHSLQSLLLAHLGIKISKEQRTTNWLASQLTDEQLAYACRDVEYLLPLLDKLNADLNRAALDETYRSCLQFLPARVLLDLGGWEDVFTY